MVRPMPSKVASTAGAPKKSDETERKSPRPRSVGHQVVLLDHGMYRRLDPEFRHTYSRLWKAFMTRDQALGQRCAVELGVEPELYDALSLILTWRPTTTSARLGARITEAERQALKEKYKTILTPDNLNDFLERLPRDMLFVMRTGDLVRSLNKDLGGTSKQRLITLAECAIRGLSIPNPESDTSQPSQRRQQQQQQQQQPHTSDAGDFVSVSRALLEEKDFREFLEREGVRHPENLSLNSPRASVNRLVASERGMVASRLSWWDWLDLRARIWAFDLGSGLVWWWFKRSSFTDRDIG